MAYLLEHTLILHAPKTGSDWVRAACQAAVNVRIREIGPWHCDLETARRLLREQQKTVSVIGTFVRHPLAWYRSAWCYWRETGRFPREDDAPRVECDDFEQFVRNCVAAEPTGYVSALFERFTGPVGESAVFVGRQETLADDLVRLLTQAGEDFDPDRVRSVPPQNVRGSRPDSVFPGYTRGLAEEILRCEQTALKRYGYEPELDRFVTDDAWSECALETTTFDEGIR